MLPPVNLTVLLAVLFSVTDLSEARPAPPGRIMIPIRRLAGDVDSSLHPSIVTTQHVSRAHKRLATFTGRDEPSTHDLLSNLHRSVAALSPALQKRYNHNGITELLAALKSFLDPSATHTNENAAHTASGSLGSAGSTPALDSAPNTPISPASSASNGFNAIDATAALNSGITPAKPVNFAHSIGMDIEANDIGYVGNVMIGTPPRNFRLLMDSGSSDLWVGSETSCQSDGGGNCGKHTFLGPQSSSSFQDMGGNWATVYGSGQVSGNLVQDTIAIGDLKLTNHIFGVAHNESTDFSANDIPLDGILGLGRRQLSNQNVDTVLDSMRKGGLLQNAIVSYKLPRLSDQRNDGEITFGGLDPAKYVAGSLVAFANVNTKGYWEGAMGAIKINGKDLGLVSSTGVLDTGTTLLVGPTADVKAIHGAIPGSKSTNGVDWTIPCTTTSVLSLNFGGQDWPIDARDLVFLPVDPNNPKGDCISAISGTAPFGGNTEWLVGDVFLKNVYFSTNSDNNQISLARLS